MKIFDASSRWGVFALSFVVMFLLMGMTQNVVNSLCPDRRCSILTISVVQGLFVFIFPTMLSWLMTSTRPWNMMGMDRSLTLRSLGWMLTLYVIAYPAMAQIIYYNADISFPDSMKGLEQTLRDWENAGADATAAIMSTTSVGGLIVNILIVGLFTGLAEEMFFRAGIQRMMMASRLSPAVAIWSAAAIFSFVHFQFFGFVPRLLLGAMFGYVYWRTGSIWAPALLHGINNSIVVVTEWINRRNGTSFDFEQYITDTSGIPWWFIFSTLLTILFIIYSNRRIPNGSGN